jgi:predicted  nucleic acid-binding Zn-ribbon protein
VPPVKASPAAQLRLLDLQSIDTSLAQLAHRRASLPELTVISEATRRDQALADEAVDVEAHITELAADQRRLESEVEVVRNRRSRDEDRLTGGGVPAKELDGLQHEVASLLRRQSTLEDDLLEIMEQREQADADLSAVNDRRAAVVTDLSLAQSARDAAFVEIDTRVRELTAERAALLAEIPSDLLALYDRLRVHQGGVGAAALRQRRCEGCHIELSGTELSNMRTAAPDEVLRCENCRRILIRTPESGL